MLSLVISGLVGATLVERSGRDLLVCFRSPKTLQSVVSTTPPASRTGEEGPKVHKTTLLVSDKGPNFQVFKAGVPPIYIHLLEIIWSKV